MRFKPRKCLLVAALSSFVLTVCLMMYITHKDKDPYLNRVGKSRGSILLDKIKQKKDDKKLTDETNPPPRAPPIDQSVLNRLKKDYPLKSSVVPNRDVHAFYYTWYGNPDHDGEYLHWNHQYLPHWDKRKRDKWLSRYHYPPMDIAANYFPELGAYSSRDPDIIAQHMLQLRRAGVGVISLSWYPPGKADDAGKPTDDIVPGLLDIAHVYGIQVNFHIEPYKFRSTGSIRENIDYILTSYGAHPAFYRHLHKGRHLPMFYVYDSYLIPSKMWPGLLLPGGSNSIRGTKLDSLIIGLEVKQEGLKDLVHSGFDGFYTYFASNGFTYGSSWNNWPAIAEFAKKNDLIFIPSVGPGYIDTEVRPWNKQNTKERNRGKYYESCFKAAVNNNPHLITITSFNEWHEGSQIEAAVVKSRGTTLYSDYRPYGPDFYLDLTRKWVEEFQTKKLNHNGDT